MPTSNGMTCAASERGASSASSNPSPNPSPNPHPNPSPNPSPSPSPSPKQARLLPDQLSLGAHAQQHRSHQGLGLGLGLGLGWDGKLSPSDLTIPPSYRTNILTP
eukprot:scaffold19396_cov46-Phaeocystis_antarctica.AAC.2